MRLAAAFLCAALSFAATPSSAADRFIAATASANDGNLPANALDGNLATRWSCKGIGCWLRVQLNADVVVSGVRIAWYKGNERSSKFILAVSRDGVAWEKVLSTASSGTTTDREIYRFAPVRARYVRVAVNGTFVGGTQTSEWASITEIVAGAAPPGREANGVWQIYPTSPQKAAAWTFGFPGWTTRAMQFGTVAGSGAASQVTGSGQVRMTVKAEDTGVGAACEGITNHTTALGQGYMCTPKDWTNFEMTGYFKLDVPATDVADREWVLYGNGGRHTGDGTELGCLGSSYKASYDYSTGQVRMSKESWHVNYDQKPWHLGLAGGIRYSETANRGRWLGMKLVRYQILRNGKAGVRLELWLDTGGLTTTGAPTNQWQIADVIEDHPDTGSWGHDARRCNAPVDDQIMLWGGPWVTWRWDNTTSRMRLMSVREIVPPTYVATWVK